MLLIGDSVRKGFIQLACQPRGSGQHISCGASINLLLKLMDPAYNGMAEHFRKVFRKLEPKKFIKMGLSHHLQARGLKKCKLSSFELLRLYSAERPSFDESQLFTCDKSYQIYARWKKRNQFSSITAERLEVQETNVFNIFHGSKQQEQDAEPELSVSGSDSSFFLKDIRKARAGMRRKSSKVFNSISEFLVNAKNLYRSNGETGVFTHSHPSHPDTLACVLNLSQEDKVDPKRCENLWNFDFLEQKVSTDYFKGKDGDRVSVKFQHDDQVFEVKGRLKKVQNQRQTIIVNFTSDAANRKRVLSCSELHNETISTVASEQNTTRDRFSSRQIGSASKSKAYHHQNTHQPKGKETNTSSTHSSELNFVCQMEFKLCEKGLVESIFGAVKCKDYLTSIILLQERFFEGVFRALEASITKSTSELARAAHGQSQGHQEVPLELNRTRSSGFGLSDVRSIREFM